MGAFVFFIIALTCVASIVKSKKEKLKTVSDEVKEVIEVKLQTSLEKMSNCENVVQLDGAKNWSLSIIEPINTLDCDVFEKSVYYKELHNKIDDTFTETKNKIMFNSLK